MEYVYTFIFSFILIYLVYYLIVIKRSKGMEAFKNGKQVLFFKNAYKLDLKKLDYKKFVKSLSFTNALIIATTVTIISLVDGLIWQLLIGFIILVPLILICYWVLGKIYKKKEGK